MQAIEAVLVTRDSEAGRGGPVAITDPFAPLADLGYAICHVPLTRTAAPSDPGPLDDAVRHLSEFSWIAFTSARAVQGFANAVAGSGTFGSAGTRASVRFACVGPATARACESVLGRSADLVARSANAAGLARELRELLAGQAGSRVLFPASPDARPDLPRTLEEAGIRVTQVEAYRVEPAPPEPDRLLPPGGADHWAAIVLTSGSIARILLESLAAIFPDRRQLETFMDRSRPAVLGPTATEALAAWGLRPWLQASTPSLEVLVREMTDRLEQDRGEPEPRRSGDR